MGHLWWFLENGTGFFIETKNLIIFHNLCNAQLTLNYLEVTPIILITQQGLEYYFVIGSSLK